MIHHFLQYHKNQAKIEKVEEGWNQDNKQTNTGRWKERLTPKVIGKTDLRPISSFHKMKGRAHMNP